MGPASRRRERVDGGDESGNLFLCRPPDHRVVNAVVGVNDEVPHVAHGAPRYLGKLVLAVRGDAARGLADHGQAAEQRFEGIWDREDLLQRVRIHHRDDGTCF